MCPACMTTAAWLIAGSTTAGGFTAILAGKWRGRRQAGNPNAPKTAHKGARHEKS